MAAVLAFLFIFGLFFFLLMDRWWGLLGAIFRGDSAHLKNDILESGICENKRTDWAPKPEPLPDIWKMNTEERNEEYKRRREQWQRSRPRYFTPSPPPPSLPVLRPKFRKRNELDDLADKMFSEL